MQNTLSLIRGFLGEMGGRLSPEASIEENRYHLPAAEARLAPSQFFDIPARPSRTMGLHLFQTGRSRTYLIGKLTMDGDVRPIHYASVASAVLSRSEGLLAPYTRPITADLILLDLDGLDQEADVVERYREGIEIIDTKPSDKSYRARRIAAMAESSRVQREMTEEGLLALKEGREEGVVAVIDGTLAGIEGAYEIPGVVGLVSAHAEVLGSESTVLECPFGARSALDEVGHPPAFYMRLHDPSGYNPDFGLVRVELGQTADGNPPDEAWATDVASLLLKERFPIDNKFENWDKSIYVLQHSKKYIDTLIPPPGVVTTYFGRSTS